MVNTFFTRYPAEAAVQDLDKARLGKQRVEAQQILNILLAAHKLVELFGYPACPQGHELTNDLERELWIKDIYKRYKVDIKAGKRLYYTTGVDGHRQFTTDITNTSVGTGFTSHPMVLMWVGYEDALKYYINACIVEWVSRGYQNNMPIHILTETPIFPWWCKCEALHKSHRSALLRKEAVRNEPEWYWSRPEITSGVCHTDWYYSGYLWVSHLTVEVRQSLRDKSDPSGHRHCDPIMNDFV